MTSLGASYRHPFHPRSMTRPCRPSAPSSTLRDPRFSTLPLRAELTRPSTQRGGGCFCNLATLSIFSIHSIPHQPSPRLLSPSLSFSLSALLFSLRTILLSSSSSACFFLASDQPRASLSPSSSFLPSSLSPLSAASHSLFHSVALRYSLLCSLSLSYHLRSFRVPSAACFPLTRERYKQAVCAGVGRERRRLERRPINGRDDIQTPGFSSSSFQASDGSVVARVRSFFSARSTPKSSFRNSVSVLKSISREISFGMILVARPRSIGVYSQLDNRAWKRSLFMALPGEISLVLRRGLYRDVDKTANDSSRTSRLSINRRDSCEASSQLRILCQTSSRFDPRSLIFPRVGYIAGNREIIRR